MNIRAPSMRPRVGSRGSLTVAFTPRSQGRAFNEAPSWFSGKCWNPTAAASTDTTFNEAPSWFSGKWVLLRRTAYTDAAFNEAPSWFSGKYNRAGRPQRS